MKKINWGVASAIIAVLFFYLTAGVVGAYLVMNQIARQTHVNATLFDSWWQTLLFVADVITFVALASSLTMYFVARNSLVRRKAIVKPGRASVLFKRSVWGVCCLFFAIAFTVSAVGGGIAQAKYRDQINGLFGLNPYRKVDVADGTADTEYYKSDFRKADGSFDNVAMRNKSLEVSLRAAEEGSVLLWNDNNALPLSEGDKINLFGIASGSYLVCEQGSGKIYPTITTTLKGELEKCGVTVNAKLVNAYKLLKAEGYIANLVRTKGIDSVNDNCYNEAVINEVPWNKLDDTKLGNVTSSLYGDAAIMFVSRISGEDTDSYKFVSDEARKDNCVDGNYTDLSQNEVDVLAHLKLLKQNGTIKKIVLVINCSNAMQFKTIKNYDVDACLWTGVGGNVSHTQVAKLLTGKANPSGKLTDTYLYDNFSSPSAENFGDFTFTAKGAGVPVDASYTHNDKYVVYQEGIYVGYRYYETRYFDSVYKQCNANGTAGVKAGNSGWRYVDEVAYPFGHGLSYTTFEHGNFSVKKVGDDFDVSVTVKNAGNVAGKDVVQVYLSKPYTDYDKTNHIEKAAVELVGYAKTDMLGVGESQTVTIRVSGYEFKTYDAYNKGTYILEKGDYYIATGTDAHNALNNILALQGKGVVDGMDKSGNPDNVYLTTIAQDDFGKYAVSPFTGSNVKNNFDSADINLYEGTKGQEITYLSRNDWQGTYPKAVRLACTSQTMVDDMQYGKAMSDEGNTAMPTFGKVSEKYGQLTLMMLKDVPYDNEYWDALLDQLTWEDANCLVSGPLSGSESVTAPGMKTLDGPFGMGKVADGLDSCMCFPCEVNLAATWNDDLVEEVGVAFGHEVMHLGYTGLYGPGANIHRSAFSGRNAEYYSEDGFLSGKMLAAECKGLQSRGVIVFTKHFLLNDMERNRYGITVWANEQSIREVYLKAFEAGVTEGKMNGIMSSFNRIGCTWAGRHAGLLTNVLRGEWGFVGECLTDAAVPAFFHQNNARPNAIVAGQDAWMGGSEKDFLVADRNNATVCNALREACHRILYTRLHSNAVNGMTANTRIQYVPTWWENTIVGLQVGLGIATLFCMAMFVTAIAINAKNSKKGENL